MWKTSSLAIAEIVHISHRILEANTDFEKKKCELMLMRRATASV